MPMTIISIPFQIIGTFSLLILNCMPPFFFNFEATLYVHCLDTFTWAQFDIEFWELKSLIITILNRFSVW